jgi:hypothetical protein
MTVQTPNEHTESKDQVNSGLLPNADTPCGKSENALNNECLEPAILPSATANESKARRRWFEEVHFPKICVQEFLPIAREVRKGDHTCRFGERMLGTYNVVIFILFDDGVEWAIKMPRGNFKEGQEDMFLMSEYATLYFLQRDIPTVPSPKVHRSCFTDNNPTKTPYFITDKVPGIPMWRAFREHERGEKRRSKCYDN